MNVFTQRESNFIGKFKIKIYFDFEKCFHCHLILNDQQLFQIILLLKNDLIHLKSTGFFFNFDNSHLHYLNSFEVLEQLQFEEFDFCYFYYSL
jgi:hypothetical protein